MAKAKIHYVCSDCGASHSKWQGQCSQCLEWNTLQTFRESPAAAQHAGQTAAAFTKAAGYSGQQSQVQLLGEVEVGEIPRTSSGSDELDRVLGGGIVPASVILLGGYPGAGKSTLLLQLAGRMSAHQEVLYVTGEESLQQLAMRAQRLKIDVSRLQVMAESDLHEVMAQVSSRKPQMLIIDSIQVMFLSELQAAAGGVTQVRECAALLTRYAKQSGTSILMVGHVTKEGALAGPKVLEHIIDTSILLEGTADSRFRLLRATKNRFGAVNELGVFAMLDSGLKDVKNPSAIFLDQTGEEAAGSLVTVAWEGSRPLLIEVQALVDNAAGSSPRRLAVGTDPQRLAMLLAVLHKHGGLQCHDQDVFINVVGGVKIAETGSDLALVLAIASSFRNRAIPRSTIVFGEIGLGGEIRPVSSGTERIIEARKHGFERFIVPKANLPKSGSAAARQLEGQSVIGVRTLAEALDQL
ncbi:DNA repair protein RadA [Allohahella marinimesophila]|uniref:DNA repair protein RadA n=1 Tax=Allohahella marinimesophila TaxID=1054972 RepID=A0ABP7PTX2_9GAMM